jgi:hypothetical protein
MPVAHVHRREGPRKPRFRQTCFHVRIIEDVPGVVKVGEGVAPDLAEDQEYHDCQGDTPKRLRGYGTCITHDMGTGFSIYLWKMESFLSPDFCRRYFMAVAKTPNPYAVLLEKLMEEASSKYLVGQLISPIRNPK